MYFHLYPTLCLSLLFPFYFSSFSLFEKHFYLSLYFSLFAVYLSIETLLISWNQLLLKSFYRIKSFHHRYEHQFHRQLKSWIHLNVASPSPLPKTCYPNFVDDFNYCFELTRDCYLCFEYKIWSIRDLTGISSRNSSQYDAQYLFRLVT